MRSISLRRPSAAMVVSCVALFSALGGSSYAAAKLTSSGIANHTIREVDVKKHTLGPKSIKADSLGGDQINEAALGIVPNADTLDGVDSAGYMKSTQRVFEVTADGVDNFTSGSPLAQLGSVPAGSYVVSAKLTYDNDGPIGGAATCTLEVPGTNDSTTFYLDNSEVLTLQKAVTAGSPFDATVSCDSDGAADILGKTSIIASRLD
jgi:hypothetical protein